MGVIAEGVERIEQVQHLKSLGIRGAQGFLFAPPLPASSYLQMVASMAPLRDASVASPDRQPRRPLAVDAA